MAGKAVCAEFCSNRSKVAAARRRLPPAARLRAAENGVPLIRAHIFGPSALINADGTIAASLPYGAAGILRGDVSMNKIPTLYAYAGSLPVYLFIAAVLLYFLILRVYNNSNARRGG